MVQSVFSHSHAAVHALTLSHGGSHSHCGSECVLILSHTVVHALTLTEVLYQGRVYFSL
ncbi:hypothetical protein glysoja_007515 [Glycine soja]|nr:hypothetical protein glysoja_007515 [Glycine soja]